MNKTSIENQLLCLSWCDADEVMNYGQILQGCAMMHLLRTYWHGEIAYVSYTPRGIKGMIRYNLKHINPVNGHLISYIKTRRLIDKFIKENGITFYQLHKEKKLEKISRNCKIAICGSDQIWHPRNFDKNYFLAFAPEQAMKVSYAASLPKRETESQYSRQMEETKRFLEDFDYIAVRESSTVDYIGRLCSKEITSVIDPTYMIPADVWRNIMEETDLPHRYIFVYVPNGMNEIMSECLENLQDKSGIVDILIMQTRGEPKFSTGKTLHFVSLGQFLYLIDHATYVLTSSFHAVVFSTIFHTDFYCYDVPNPVRGEDVRLSDLTNLLGVKERLVSNGRIHLEQPIHYEEIDAILNKEREHADAYLQKVFSGLNSQA